MHLPDYVEPFVESEPDRWLLTGAVVATVALALLSEADARALGYVGAVAIGAVTAWLFASRSGAADPAAALPRLPVFLRFDNRRVVVVGGGAVAAAKIPALLAAGANVTVIAPSISTEIDRARVAVIERSFEPADLDGAWFVTAAATPAINRQVRDAAESRGLFVNAVDDPANATAYLGGTVARGGVTVAFSTSGEAPALAGLLREAFDELLPEDLETWVQRASELRTRQRADGVPMSARRPLLLDALNDLYENRRRETAGPA
jgi:uroporphyrin-III C-methyltransferase/precorrin-2 dehydrogenase/sirohydrochlorin ferrochelatase